MKGSINNMAQYKCINESCDFTMEEPFPFCPKCGQKQETVAQSTEKTVEDNNIPEIKVKIVNFKRPQSTEAPAQTNKEPRAAAPSFVKKTAEEISAIPEVNLDIEKDEPTPPVEKVAKEHHEDEQYKTIRHATKEDANKAATTRGLSEKLQMSEEKYEEAKKRLHDMCLTEEMENTLFNIISPSTRGFRCFFLGEPGTAKEKTLEKLCELLYDIGKIKEKEVTWISFGNIPERFDTNKFYVIDDMSTAIAHLFNLDDFSDEANQQQKRYQDLMGILMTAPRTAYIILNGRTTERDGFISLDARISYIFDKKVVFEDISNQEVFNRFKRQIPDTHIEQITPEFEKEFVAYLDRNRRFFPFNNQELADYLCSYVTRTPQITLPKEKYNPKTLDETFAKIIGMEDVKRQVRELDQYLRIRNKLKDAGAKLPDFNLHMMFLGNPGVGKTSIARIIAKTLFELGFCREEKLVEVTSKDLIGAYGNQTGIKTNRAIMNALGGVLFVDEAYSLSNSCGQAGAEAIAILIKAMVDYRDDLVIMFAGYNLEMKSFIESNSGIASRISYIFKFEDYSPEELFDIYKLKLGFIGMKSDESADEAVRKLCKFASGRHNAGNGRFIDNLIQKALTKHALLDLDNENILTITRKSIPTVEEIMATTFN